MKQFFKMAFATVVGLFLFQIIVFVLFLIFIIGMVGLSSTQSVDVKSNTLLVLNLEGNIVERSVDNPFEKYMGNGFGSTKEIGLKTIVDNIKKAKNDENIVGISLKLDKMNASVATLEEIRDALADFKESEKFVYAYGDIYSQGAYYLASVSDKVFFNPEGMFLLQGLSSSILFFKNLLNKMDIEMQVVKVGTYKSAVEPYILESMSEANREQMSRLLNSIWDKMSTQICESRSMEATTFQAACDNLTLLGNNSKTLELGFVDSLVYADQYLSFLKKQMKVADDKDLSTISLKQYNNVPAKTQSSHNKIAVLYAVGNIMMDEGSSSSIGKNITDELVKLRKDKKVKAIVLRINSGGGDALMSENIWREVVKTKAEKPIVVSMGDLAASGGYYIACAANYIVAQHNTITGSIGVFGMFPNTKSFLNNKIGVNVEVVSTNAHSDALGIFRPMDEVERATMQRNVNHTYDVFLTRVADGRNLTKEKVDSIGQGRVWSGIDALELGLVDTLGNLNVAINKAADLAGISKYTLKDYPVLKDFYTELSESFLENMMIKHIKNSTYLQYAMPYLEAMKTAKQIEGIQTRLPYQITIQ